MPWTLSNKSNTGLTYTNNLTGESCSLSKIWSHNELGDFYAFDNLMSMPYQRKYIFDVAQQMERIGIDKEEMISSMTDIMNLCKEKKPGFEMDVFAKAQLIQSTLKDGWDYEKTAMLTCAMIIVQEGDIIDTFNQEEAVKRLNLWSKDKPMMGFFLSIANQRCSNLINSLDPFTQMSSGNLSL